MASVWSSNTDPDFWENLEYSWASQERNQRDLTKWYLSVKLPFSKHINNFEIWGTKKKSCLKGEYVLLASALLPGLTVCWFKKVLSPPSCGFCISNQTCCIHVLLFLICCIISDSLWPTASRRFILSRPSADAGYPGRVSLMINGPTVKLCNGIQSKISNLDYEHVSCHRQSRF